MDTATQGDANMTASQFTYDVYSNDAADDFFTLMQRAGVQQERIAAMRATRENFLASLR